MTRTIWLASYPKSGNTWLRVLIENLSAGDRGPVDINDLSERGAIASARAPFDNITLIESGLLAHDEADNLRPRVYEELISGMPAGTFDASGAPIPIRFAKVHDAYTLTQAGEPLLAGSRGAHGAIVIVRDPRDVACSLANHNNSSIDEAISFMANKNAGLSVNPKNQHIQLRQRLLDWSGHVGSWLDQPDIPIHPVRYEDLRADTIGTLTLALAFAGHPATAHEIRRAVAFSDFAILQKQEQEKGFHEAPRPLSNRRFFRQGVAGGWRNELTQDQTVAIETTHSDMMARLGYGLSARAEARPKMQER